MVQLPFGPGPVHAGTWVALLLEAAAKGTVLLIVVALAMRLLRRSTAAARHWILTCSAAAVLALPILSVLLPVWPLPIFPDTALWSYAMAKVGSPDVAGALADVSHAAVSRRPADRVALADLPAKERQPREGSTPARAEAPPSSRPWRAALLLVWVSGTALCLVRLIAGTAAAHRIASRAARFGDERIARMARSLSRELRLDTPVRILRSAEIETPFTLGVLEPLVLLPWDADRWLDTRLRVALLHELSHVKRHDCFAQLVADVASAFYWFHPVVWYTARRLRLERELACDDCVIRSGVKPSQYAAHLLDLACSLAGRPTPRFALYFAQPSRLQERVHAILNPHANHRAPSRAEFAIALLLIAALLVPLAALDPWTTGRSPVSAARSLFSVVDTD